MVWPAMAAPAAELHFQDKCGLGAEGYHRDPDAKSCTLVSKIISLKGGKPKH